MFSSDTVIKNLPAYARDAWDVGLILGLGRSHGVGNCKLLQYSCLENSMDRGAWQAIVHGEAKSQTQLSDWAHKCYVVNIDMYRLSQTLFHLLSLKSFNHFDSSDNKITNSYYLMPWIIYSLKKKISTLVLHLSIHQRLFATPWKFSSLLPLAFEHSVLLLEHFYFQFHLVFSLNPIHIFNTCYKCYFSR